MGGASGKLLLGFMGFFVVFPGIGLLLAAYFIGLFAWEAKEYTTASIVYIIALPWLVMIVLELLIDGAGYVAMFLAYPYQLIVGSILVFMPMSEDMRYAWIRVDDASLEKVGLFAIFVPMLLFMFGWATNLVPMWIGKSMKDLIGQGSERGSV